MFQTASVIGMPTNVTHTGHARTMEEAELIIEKLMNPSPSAGDNLPSPLKPSQQCLTFSVLIYLCSVVPFTGDLALLIGRHEGQWICKKCIPLQQTIFGMSFSCSLI